MALHTLSPSFLIAAWLRSRVCTPQFMRRALSSKWQREPPEFRAQPRQSEAARQSDSRLGSHLLEVQAAHGLEQPGCGRPFRTFVVDPRHLFARDYPVKYLNASVSAWHFITRESHMRCAETKTSVVLPVTGAHDGDFSSLREVHS